MRGGRGVTVRQGKRDHVRHRRDLRAGLDNTNSGDYKANYFATMSGTARAHGFLRVDVMATTLAARLVRTGGGRLSDQFVIGAVEGSTS